MADLSGSVLLLGTDSQLSSGIACMLEAAGLTSAKAQSLRAAASELERTPCELAVVDLESSGEPSGLALVRAFAQSYPDVPVVALGKQAGVSDVVDAVKAGAADFLGKPVAEQDLLHAVKKALASVARSEPNPPPPSDTGSSLLGDSEPMLRVRDLIRRVATGTATVLIRGESGTGKDLVARALHEESGRSDGPYVKVHCAALPDALLESELFGYEKGAFTGAQARKLGRVDLADGGTLFLDEIGDITAALQVKLLRLLEDRRFERLGATQTLTADVRFVAATHRDLESMVQQRTFREDLFYRLNVITVWLPPLRARREDVVTLARHFCAEFAAQHAKHGLAFDDRSLELLRSQRWPGNVRQLRNLIERLVVLAEGSRLGAAEVERELAPVGLFKTQLTPSPGLAISRHGTLESEAEPARRTADGPISSINPGKVASLSDELRGAERKALMRALKHAAGNRSLAARILGVSRTTLYAKLEEYGIA
jgi:two-component system, NtrC family, response regulator AtoC